MPNPPPGPERDTELGCRRLYAGDRKGRLTNPVREYRPLGKSCIYSRVCCAETFGQAVNVRRDASFSSQDTCGHLDLLRDAVHLIEPITCRAQTLEHIQCLIAKRLL